MGKDRMKFSVVVPCYDEEKNLSLILERFSAVITNDCMEVLLVDNGSTDATPEILPKIIETYSFAKSIRVEVNQGYGYGILQGLKACTGDYIGWTHADMQTDPADVIKAFRYIQKKDNGGNLFLKGNRKGRPVFDQFFTTGMSVFETFYLGEKLVDVNAQPNIFPRSFFEKWKNPPSDFALDLYVLYMAQKYNLEIHRFPVAFPERIHGVSKWNNEGLKSKWKFIKRTLAFSVKLKKEGIE